MSRLRIGVLGGGQLGRMMALAGYPLDLGFSFYEAAPHCPSAGLGPVFGDAQHSPASLDATPGYRCLQALGLRLRCRETNSRSG